MTVNVALVDDHLVFREAFRALLAAFLKDHVEEGVPEVHCKSL